MTETIADSTRAENPPKPQKPSDAERLDRIEKGIAELRKLAIKENRKDRDLRKKNSRATVTLAFGFIGMKVGALVATKVLAGKEIYAWYKGNDADRLVADYKSKIAEAKEKSGDIIEASVEYMLRLFVKNEAFLKNLFVKSLIGSVIGFVLGGAVGWARGDRLEHPDDLFKHPIDSMKRIFGTKPPAKPKDDLPEIEEDKASTTLKSKPALTVKKDPPAPPPAPEEKKPWGDRVVPKEMEISGVAPLL